MASGIQKPIAPLTTTTPTPAVDAPATAEKRLLTPAELAAKRALQEQRDSTGFARDGKKPVPTISSGVQKDGITFQTSRPTFKKSENVGNKGDFPELGEENQKAGITKASIGGLIGQVTAPAKSFTSSRT